MLTIRLQRVGRKNDPSFRVVVTEAKNAAKGGKFLEVLGSYDARQGKGKAQLSADRIKHWLSVGATLSDTVHNILLSKKIITGEKRAVKMPAKPAAVNDAVEVPVEVAVEPVAEPAEAPAPEGESTPIEEPPKTEEASA